MKIPLLTIGFWLVGVIWKIGPAVTIDASSSIEEAPGWEERTEWPDDYPRPPRTARSLFFIQRNLNKNTIVYDLDMENGRVRKRHPIDAYWLRYGEDGAKQELSWLQAVLAYGYTSSQADDGFQIKLKAYNDRYIQLVKHAGNWIPTMEINGIVAAVNNIYVYADESGIFPDVKYVDIYGTTLQTGQLVKERIEN